MDVSKLVVEGFDLKWARERLRERGIAFNDKEQSLALLEKLAGARFDGLREFQRIRSKVKGHAGSSEAREIIERAIADYETLSNHFTAACRVVVDELRAIEAASSQRYGLS
jgi:hypothetical protein